MKKVTIVLLVLLVNAFRLNAQVASQATGPVSKQEINIFTNPSADAINITTADKDKHLALDLYDIYGKKVFSKSFRGNTEKIAASQLALGTYTVIIYADGNVVRTQKIRID